MYTPCPHIQLSQEPELSICVVPMGEPLRIAGHKPRHNRLCWLSQNRTEKRSCIRRLKGRETEHFLLMKPTLMTSKFGRRDLTNRVIIPFTNLGSEADLVPRWTRGPSRAQANPANTSFPSMRFPVV